MFYSHIDIQHALDKGDLKVVPLLPGQIQPASIDLHLGTHIKVLDPRCESLSNRRTGKWVEYPLDKSRLLRPGELMLAATMERVKLGRNIVGVIEGLSSLGRIGLNTCSACGLIDPGFEGTITLELWSSGFQSIELFPTMRAAQLMLFELKTPATDLYKGKYQNQVDAKPAEVGF